MPMRAWRVDPCWVPRLRAAGLLPLERMVEVMWEDDQDRAGDGRMSRRFSYDRYFLMALVDWWRPSVRGDGIDALGRDLPDRVALRGLPLGGARRPSHVAYRVPRKVPGGARRRACLARLWLS